MLRSSHDSTENQRLDSWKEIASFFGRDERTVKRWERSRSLPVHRIPGGERGGVFAYTAELTRWLNTPLAAPPMPEKQLDVAPTGSTPSGLNASSVTPAHPAVRPREPEILAERAHLSPVELRSPSHSSFMLFRSACMESRLVLTLTSSTSAISRMPKPRSCTCAADTTGTEELGDDLNHAVADFTQAIAHDPSDAEAYAGLADSYNLIREYGSMPESEAYPRAFAAASKAVALDDSLAEAHRALAFDLFYWKWDIPNALKEYQKAIRLDPKNVEAHHWYATALLDLGRYSESLAEIEHARTLDPSSPAILADRGLILFLSGDRSGGIAALREIEQSEPLFLSPPRYLALACLIQQDYPNFITELERAASISGDPQEQAIAKAARTGWNAGGKRPMLQAMKRVQQASFDQRHTSGFDLAYTSLLLGEKADAIRYLHAAYAARDPKLFLITRNRFEADLKGRSRIPTAQAQLQTYEQ